MKIFFYLDRKKIQKPIYYKNYKRIYKMLFL